MGGAAGAAGVDVDPGRGVGAELVGGEHLHVDAGGGVEEEVFVEVVELDELVGGGADVEDVVDVDGLERLGARDAGDVAVVELGVVVGVGGEAVPVEDEHRRGAGRGRVAGEERLEVGGRGQRQVGGDHAAGVRPVVEEEDGVEHVGAARGEGDRLGAGEVDDQRRLRVDVAEERGHGLAAAVGGVHGGGEDGPERVPERDDGGGVAGRDGARQGRGRLEEGGDVEGQVPRAHRAHVVGQAREGRPIEGLGAGAVEGEALHRRSEAPAVELLHLEEPVDLGADLGILGGRLARRGHEAGHDAARHQDALQRGAAGDRRRGRGADAPLPPPGPRDPAEDRRGAGRGAGSSSCAGGSRSGRLMRSTVSTSRAGEFEQGGGEAGRKEKSMNLPVSPPPCEPSSVRFPQGSRDGRREQRASDERILHGV